MTYDADNLGGDARCAKCGYSVRGLVSPVCPECGAELHVDGSVLVAVPLGWARLCWHVGRCALFWGIVWAGLMGLLWCAYPAHYTVRSSISFCPDDQWPMQHYFLSAYGVRLSRPWILCRGDVEFTRFLVFGADIRNALPCMPISIRREGAGVVLANSAQEEPVSPDKLHELLLEDPPCGGDYEGAKDHVAAIWHTVANTRFALPTKYLDDYEGKVERSDTERRVRHVQPVQDSVAAKLISAAMVLFVSWRCTLVAKRIKFRATSLAGLQTDGKPFRET